MKVFEKDNHRIILGDALQVLEQVVPNKSVHLIFADPPYNIGKNFSGLIDKWPSEQEYIAWCYKWIDLCIEKLTDNGSFYIMMATQYMPYIDIYIREKMSILSRIVWYYDSSGVQARKYYGSLYEPILFCVKDRKNYAFNADEILIPAKTGAQRKLIDYRKAVPTTYNTEKVPGNVWQIPRVRYRMEEYENHPSQKPITLLERIIKASSNIGEVVLDPFSGTFTTSYVAKTLGRQSIGIDISEDYVNIGMRRLNIYDRAHQGEDNRADRVSILNGDDLGQIRMEL